MAVIYSSYLVDIMAASALATQVATASVTMILPQLNRDNMAPARKGLLRKIAGRVHVISTKNPGS